MGITRDCAFFFVFQNKKNMMWKLNQCEALGKSPPRIIYILKCDILMYVNRRKVLPFATFDLLLSNANVCKMHTLYLLGHCNIILKQEQSLLTCTVYDEWKCASWILDCKQDRMNWRNFIYKFHSTYTTTYAIV